VEISRYDIFSGWKNKDAMWLEAIDGLITACDKMKQHAKLIPGPYFVYCVDTQRVLASVDTLISPDIQNPALA
jgi:hypothetical protein